MKRHNLLNGLTVVLLLSVAFVPAPSNSFATPIEDVDFSTITADGIFMFAPDYQPAQVPPDYQSEGPIINGDSYVEDEVILRFRSDVTPEQQNALMSAYGMHRGRQSWGDRAFAAKVPIGRAMTVTRALQHNPLLEIASLNPVVYLDGYTETDSNPHINLGVETTTRDYPGMDAKAGTGTSSPTNDEVSCVNDPLAGQQQHLFGYRLFACGAWQFSHGLGPVSKIAIIDTGIAAANHLATPVPHPDFAGKFWDENWQTFVDENKLQDADGHGTHVAGIATANTNNNMGIAGVAYGAWPMSLKVVKGCGRINSSDTCKRSAVGC